MNLANYIETIPNFPEEGILFRDITPLLNSKEAFSYTINQLDEFCKEVGAEIILGPESRGFIFATPVVKDLGLGFVPIRKKGKLPRETISVKYDLEYGSNELFIHADAIKKGQKVVVIDDLLATGGTVDAACKLVEKLGGEVVGLAFVIELDALKGRELLKNYKIFSLLHY